MDYKIELSDVELNSYLDKLINRTFAILGVYEDCSLIDAYENYYTYVERLALELKGCSFSLDKNDFLSLYNVLIGMANSDIMAHKKVKSLVFYCISVIKKMKVI